MIKRRARRRYLAPKNKPNGEPFSFGDIREDGYRFFGYEKRNGKIRAKWYSPKGWESVKEAQRKYQAVNREALAGREKERASADSLYLLRKRIRQDVQKAPELKRFARTKIHDILGCSSEDLKKILEHRFQEGMSWENRDEWYIGHGTPLSEGKTAEEIRRLNHHSNLVPKWRRKP